MGAAVALHSGRLAAARLLYAFSCASGRTCRPGTWLGTSTCWRPPLRPACPPLPLQEDPLILFEPVPSLEVGLERLRELWPGLTPDALGNSEPLHLSLAVKALGLTGPPKGF